MTRCAELASIYLRIGRTYWRWAPSLLLLAVVVFVPLGLIHALTLEGNISSFDFDSGLKLLALFGAVMALAATGLVGEVFYTGAVSILLTHPHEDGPPSMREIAGMIKYGPLIAIDLLYGFAVGLGWFFFLIPGILIYVWFGLAAPVMEIEHRGIRASLRRSVQLVRRKFWIVALVLIPLEFVGNALTELAIHATHGLFGSEFICEWLADVLANIAFTPFYAVAAVLLTVDLIREKGGGAELHPAPVTAGQAPAAATPPSP